MVIFLLAAAIGFLIAGFSGAAWGIVTIFAIPLAVFALIFIICALTD